MSDTTIIGGVQSGPPPGSAVPSTLKISLTVIDGPAKDTKYQLTKTPTTIGRKDTNDIMLTDPAISGNHASIEVALETLKFTDLGSTNGSFLNGERVTDPVTVNNMDELRLGDTRMLVSIVKDTYGIYGDDFMGAETTGLAAGAARYGIVYVCGFPGATEGVVVQEAKKANLTDDLRVVKNGSELLEMVGADLAAGKGPEVILTEVKVPLLNGINTAIALRAIERGFGRNPAPIVFLSAQPMDDQLQKAVNFVKPARYMQAEGNLAGLGQQVRAICGKLLEMRQAG